MTFSNVRAPFDTGVNIVGVDPACHPQLHILSSDHINPNHDNDPWIFQSHRVGKLNRLWRIGLGPNAGLSRRLTAKRGE